jgi:hypothetical protein
MARTTLRNQNGHPDLSAGVQRGNRAGYVGLGE